MLRLLALPFTLALALLSAFLVLGGMAVLEETADGGDEASPFFGIFTDREAAREEARQGTFVGTALIGLGLLGLIVAVALTIVALSGGRRERAAVAPMQQQQQVVVVTDGEARVRTQ